MRIADMIAREDFYKLLRDTIEEYAAEVLGRTVILTYEKRNGLVPLIVNSHFSFVATSPVPQGLKQFLHAEYNIRNSWLKYVAGKALVMAVCYCPQIGMNRKAYISEGILGPNAFISPQNRSVRFFDYDTMMVDCIVKKGFSDKYFRNQIDFRMKYQYDFMLPMTAHGENWFREPIMTGHPLARVTNESVYRKGIEKALKDVAQLAADTMEGTSSDVYIAAKAESIRQKLAVSAERKQVVNAIRIKEITEILEKRASAVRITVPTVIGHGDFQSGNIWADKSGRILIYDWETAGRRSIWYDAATLNYSLRRAYGWKHLLSDETGKGLLTADPRKNYAPDEIRVIRDVVLLEDVLFYLDDMLELPEDWGGGIFDRFAECMITLLDEGKI